MVAGTRTPIRFARRSTSFRRAGEIIWPGAQLSRSRRRGKPAIERSIASKARRGPNYLRRKNDFYKPSLGNQL